MTLNVKVRLGVVLLMGSIAGCMDAPGGDEKPARDEVKQDDGKEEQWGTSDGPGGFSSSLEYTLAKLPMQGEATNIPWASSYWPVYEDSINYRWGGANTDSPAKKYEKAFGGTGVEDAVSLYHGINANSDRTACTSDSQCDAKIGEACAKRTGQSAGYCIPTWWGICHAWSPAAILVPEPKHAVTRNGVTFNVMDIKALVTLVHNETNTKFVSLRCELDNDANAVNFDNYGRPTGQDCRDTNPGTYHVLLTNYLGMQKASFVEDRTFDDEVWNQPLRGYRIKTQREVSASEANGLVGVSPVGGTTVTKTGTVAASAWAHQGSFAVTPGSPVKVAMTGSGDADLYVRFGGVPTAATYDCRPYSSTTSETCALVVPAGATSVYVSVNGYAASSTFSLAITTGGTISSTYQFDPRAAKLYYVSTEVDYIAEAPASADGNLASQIDKYTQTDAYEYILEVDSSGKIIGGEWVNGSKTDHPDFVWLPLSHSGDSVAGGKITYAQVKSILDESLDLNTGGGTTTGTVKTVNDSGAIAKSAWKQLGPFNVAAGKNFTATMTGDGDADLYVRKNAAPTTTAYDCRPYLNGTNESCTIVGPAVVYVGVNGYAATSNYQLAINYTEGTGSGTVTPPPTFTHLNTSGTVALGEMKIFQLPMPAGKKITIKTGSAVDVDLYIQMNAAPTTDAYLARAWTTSGNETLTYTATENGTLYIGVDGYAAGSFTLKTQD